MNRSALKIAGIYLIIGAAAIIATDYLISAWAETPEAALRLQARKDWLAVAATGLFLYWLIAREIAAREKTEEVLRQSQAQFAGIIGSAMDAIISIDENQRIVLYNSAAETMFGVPVAEALGKPLDRFIPERFRADHHGHIQAFGRTHTTRRRMGTLGTVIGLRANGEEFPLEASIAQIAVGGRKWYSAILRDLTERQRVERQLLRAQRLESIGTLAGGVAHDLNNVLTPMMMAVKLLKKDRPEKDRQGLLTTLQTSVERGAEMVKQVLAFAGGIEGERIALDVKHVIREVQTILQHTLPKTVALQTATADPLWPVLGDATQLAQVLMNLGVNARDAMPNGGALTIAAANVHVDDTRARMMVGAQTGPYVQVTVTDTGTGIAADVMDKIFDPFFTTKDKSKGTGLGLSTALGIVKSHRGYINVYSEAGKGTTFTIYLPAIESAEVAQSAPAPQALPLGKGETILVVDDEPAILETVKATLEAHGYLAIAAGSGKEAVEIYARHRQEIRAVLLDMMMPEMDGLETLRQLRTMDAEVRVIASSGLRTADKAAEASTAGANLFLPKPYAADSLLEALGRILASP